MFPNQYARGNARNRLPIVGGGVCQVDGLHSKTHAKLIQIAAGFFSSARVTNDVVAPMLGQESEGAV
ncbi:MAG: hypothetical protein JHD00_11585 [Akkermansiaceae bacterium]|nr:hypothetical protein [Akkermansiaceae bacterium]